MICKCITTDFLAVSPQILKLCDTITISEPNKPIRKIKPRVNFFNNPLVSWKGEFDMFCATDGSLAAQEGRHVKMAIQLMVILMS